jgi:ketopantoate reductase
MGKFKLILGNITFHHFTEEELKLFKTDSEQKALVHEIVSVKEFEDMEKAIECGEDALGDCCESYVVEGAFNGEIVFDIDLPF